MVTAAAYENGGISPEETARMEQHAADLAQEEVNRGLLPDAIVELGYVEVPEKPEVSPLTREQIEEADAAIMSGEILVAHETKKPTPKKTPEPVKQPKQKPKPKARTAREKRIRDSRDDLKPWPYGSKEEN